MSLARQALGQDGEDRAARLLREAGCDILERGFKTPFGEIDLIARDGPTLVFVEVKTRRGYRFGSPEEAVGTRKQAHMAKAALMYLQRCKMSGAPVRFDVISVSPQGLRHIRDAFSVPGCAW